MCRYIDLAAERGARLVAFPEFSFGGVYGPHATVAEIKKYQCISIPGLQTDVLAEKAIRYNLYIVACNNENDPVVSDYFFNTAFIINPKGKIILKYRKLNIRFGLNPHDLLDRYVNPVTGMLDPFPVVETELGRLAVMICGDINIPEIPRIYAIKGADVIVRCDSGYGAWEMAQWTLRVRARDNKIYIVNENWAARIMGVQEIAPGHTAPILDTQGGGGSCIIDYRGTVIAKASGTAPQLVTGEGSSSSSALIDVVACRRYRETTLDGVAGIKTELYAPYYNKPIFPVNKYLSEGPASSRSDPKLKRWEQEAQDNIMKLAGYYSENSIR
jgi:predicted amidohydrolase